MKKHCIQSVHANIRFDLLASLGSGHFALGIRNTPALQEFCFLQRSFANITPVALYEVGRLADKDEMVYQ